MSEAGLASVDTSRFSMRVNDTQHRQQVRLNIDYKFSKEVRLRGRIEKVFLNTEASGKHEEGSMFYQDVQFRSSDRWWWDMRIAFFHTDFYDTRIYEYERDLEGVLALPALYGNGVRWYLVAQYQIMNEVRLSVKYSDIIRDDVRHIGTGLDELPTNHDNKIGVQMDFRF